MAANSHIQNPFLTILHYLHLHRQMQVLALCTRIRDRTDMFTSRRHFGY